MFTEIIWRILLLETFVMGALCCLCTYEHPQKQFRQSEFVLKVEVLVEFNMPMRKAFWMEIKQIFKGNVQELMLIGDPYVILTFPTNCTFEYMKLEHEYVIFGQNQNGYVHTDKCSGNKLWAKTTEFYRYALETAYKDNCDCYNEIPRYSVFKDCHWKYSFLVMRDENCSWEKYTYFRICEKESVLIRK